LRQHRQAFYLQPPALVIAQVKMKRIVFIADHLVDVLLHLLFGKKMAADIQHQATPAKTGIIGDLGAGHPLVEACASGGSSCSTVCNP